MGTLEFATEAVTNFRITSSSASSKCAIQSVGDGQVVGVECLRLNLCSEMAFNGLDLVNSTDYANCPSSKEIPPHWDW